MTFYESIFLRQFSMKLLGLPTTKRFLSFILGCLQDMYSAWPFRPFSPVSTQPYQNSQAKLKSCRHPRIKLKKNVLWLGDLKASLRIAVKKLIHKTRHLVYMLSLIFSNHTYTIYSVFWLIIPLSNIKDFNDRINFSGRQAVASQESKYMVE